MSTDFVILSQQKPAKGSDCNGCGYCCQNEACQLSRDHLFSAAAPCIALEFDGSQYRCGLLVRPHHYMPGFDDKPWIDEVIIPLFVKALGAGMGCDAE